MSQSKLIKEKYRQNLRDLLVKIGREDLVPEVATLNPFEVAFDFFNQSPRINANSLKNDLIRLDEISSENTLPDFLQERKRLDLSLAGRVYYQITEPLFNDRFFIFLNNYENEMRAEIEKEGGEGHKAKLQLQLKTIEEQKNQYIKYMDKIRIALLEAVRNDYIDALEETVKNVFATDDIAEKLILSDLQQIKNLTRKNGLSRRSDCLKNFGLPLDRIDDIQKKGISKNALETLTNLCKHYNDVCYLNVESYSKTEIFFSALKAITPLIGLTLTILGIVGIIPTFGFSGTFIAIGIGITLSPAIIEGLGHTIHCAFRRRAPDFVRVVMMASSLIMGSLAFITAGVGPTLAGVIAHPQLVQAGLAIAAIFPSAGIRQLFARPRQGINDFFANLLDFPYYLMGVKRRVDKNASWAESKPGLSVQATNVDLKKSNPATTPVLEATANSEVKSKAGHSAKLAPQANIYKILKGYEIYITALIFLISQAAQKSQHHLHLPGWHKQKTPPQSEIASPVSKAEPTHKVMLKNSPEIEVTPVEQGKSNYSIRRTQD